MAEMDDFFQLLVIGLNNGGILALNAMAVTVIYCAVRTLNLAHGDVYALSSVMTMLVLRNMLPATGATIPELLVAVALAFVITVVFGMLINSLVEFLGFRMFRGQSRLAPIIATLGLSYGLYQLALVWRQLLPNFSRGDHRSVPGVPELPRDAIPQVLSNIDVFKWLGIETAVRFDFKDVLIILVAPVAAILVHLFLQRSKIGKSIRAVAQNPVASQMVGINLNGTMRTAFVIGGALAGLAAFVFAVTVERPVANHGAQSGLIAFTAAILGGIGNPLGALAASMAVGVFAAYSDYLFDGRWTPAFIYIMLVALLMWRPSGLAAEERSGELHSQRSESIVLNATSNSTKLRPGMVLVNLLPLAVLYPLIVPLIGEYWLPVINNVLIWAIFALGLTVLLGFAGVLDVGYALNFAIGGYLVAYLTGPAMAWRDQWLGGIVPDGVIVLIIVVLATGTLGMLKGWLTSRMRTDYLAIATLALSLIMRDVLKHSGVGGVGGFSAIPVPTLFGFTLTSFTMQYALLMVVVAFVVIGAYRLLNSRSGRALAAVREDEYAALSSGVNVPFYKTLAFFIGDGIAGLAGGLYAMVLSYVEPGLADFNTSVMVLAMVSIGGVGNIAGAVIGTVTILGLDRVAIPLFQSLFGEQAFVMFSFRELSYLLFGLALYGSVLVASWQLRRRSIEGTT